MGSDATADPRLAPLARLGKVLAREHPHLAIALVDLEAAATPRARPPGASSRSRALRCRARSPGAVERRWVRCWSLSNAPAAVGLPLREGGVCLIVGGAGGIGQLVAEHLMRTRQGRVALVGRRPEPAGLVADLVGRAGSGKALYVQADAADSVAIRAAVAAIEERWGRVDAAIHAALVLDDRSLLRLDPGSLARAMAPRAAAALALADALSGSSLDFLAFFSSANVLAGAPGQGNYVAGTAFMDAFADHLRARSRFPVLTINWGLWGEVGAVKEQRYQERLIREGILPINPREGLAALDMVGALGSAQIAAVKLSPERLAELIGEPSPEAAPASLAELVAHERQPDAVVAALRVLRRLERWALMKLAMQLAESASIAKGRPLTPEALRRAIGVAPERVSLFEALIDALAEAMLVDTSEGLRRWSMDADELRQVLAELERELEREALAAPWLEGPRRLLERCLASYPDLLRGKADPVAVLFPGGSLDLVEGAYAGNPVSDHCNAVAARVAAAEVRGRPPQGRLTLLEVGAGTGSGAAPLIEALALERGAAPLPLYRRLGRVPEAG